MRATMLVSRRSLAFAGCGSDGRRAAAISAPVAAATAAAAAAVTATPPISRRARPISPARPCAATATPTARAGTCAPRAPAAHGSTRPAPAAATPAPARRPPAPTSARSATRRRRARASCGTPPAGAFVAADPAARLHDRARDYDRLRRAHQLVQGAVCNAVYTDASRATLAYFSGTGDAALWSGTSLAAEAWRYRTTGAPDAAAEMARLTRRCTGSSTSRASRRTWRASPCRRATRRRSST